MKPKLTRSSTSRASSGSTRSLQRAPSSASRLSRSATEMVKEPSMKRTASQMSRRSTNQSNHSSFKRDSMNKVVSENIYSRKNTEEIPPIEKKHSSVASMKARQSSQQLKRKTSSVAKIPIKRARKAPNRFAATEENDQATKPKSKPANVEQKVLYYNKGDFLAVKSDEEDGGFYLCQAVQHVYKSTKQFMIQWLNKDDGTDLYEKDYCDFTELDCILLEIKLDRRGRGVYCLPDPQLTRIQNAIGGQFSGSEEEKSEDEEPKRKKAKKVTATKTEKPKAKTAKQKVKEKKEKIKKEKVKKERVKKEKKVKPPKVPKRKGANRKLVPNTNIKVWDENPLFFSRDKVPFISTSAHSKLVFRAVFLKDKKLLRECIDNVEQISNISPRQTPFLAIDPFDYAIKMRDIKAVQMLAKEMHRPFDVEHKKRVHSTTSLLLTIGTGSYNPKSLGLPVIRPLSMSRGCREGNNALNQDDNDLYFNIHEKVVLALQDGVDLDFIEKMMLACDQGNYNHYLYQNIYQAVRRGHRKLAGQLMTKAEKALGPVNWNFLHKDVLLFDNEDLRPLKSASVTKKPSDNVTILPVHCAAINPNPKYLSTLMSVCPEYDIPDKQNRRPVHYAAVCPSSAVLEFLVKHNVKLEEFDNQGWSPLMVASEAGAIHNVEFLLKHAKEVAEQTEGQEVNFAQSKFGIGQINRGNKKGYTALHLACMNGHLDVMELLLEYGADIKRKLSATKNRLTVLMIACERGEYEIVKYLNDLNVQIEQKDKLGRTALIHAVLNGHAHIASFLISLGADPKAADSSGNSCIHYACAYGWYYCFQLLIEAGADPNQSNDWKMQPLTIAFLKGHNGLVDLLLEQPGVDINCPDERGMTLLAILCSSSNLTDDLVTQIQYLMNDKKADPNRADINDNTCLHHLANQTVLYNSYWNHGYNDHLVEMTVKVAKLLLKKDCSPNAKNKDGITPMNLALQELNIELVKLFVKEGGEVTTEADKSGQTALHRLAEKCTNHDMSSVIKNLASKTGTNRCRNAMISMCQSYDNAGHTPLISACLQYKKIMMSSNQEDNIANGKSFIQSLIDLCQADINATVQKIKVPDESTENPKYGEHGMCNVLHILCSQNPTKNEQWDVIKLIMKHKPDVNNMDFHGNTILIRAIRERNLDLFKMMIKAGADVNLYMKKSSDPERTKSFSEIMKAPLLLAVESDREKMITTLLDKGADISSKDEEGNTAVHILSMHGRQRKYAEKLLKRLLDMGCGINDRNLQLRTPFHFAVDSNVAGIDASTEFEEILMDNGADLFAKDFHGRLPLHYAFVKIRSQSGKSAFDPIELCSNLCLAMKGKQIDAADNFGKTPLSYAAHRGASVCCMHLLQRKAKMDGKCLSGNTPVCMAVLNSQESCAMMFIQRGSNININVVTYDPEQNPPTVQTEEKKKKKFWVWQPTVTKEKKAAPPTKEEVPLFQLCVQHGWQGLIYLILDVLDKFNMPFARCVEASIVCNKFHLALTLMRKLTDESQLQTLNRHQCSLMHSLCQTQTNIPGDLYVRVAEVLLRAGVSLTSPDNRQMTPLHYAVLNNHPYLVDFILKNASDLDIESCDQFERTPFAAAFWKKQCGWNIQIVEKLAKEGADMDVLSDYGFKEGPLFGYSAEKPEDYYEQYADQIKVSPLILSVICENSMVKTLLRLGASPSFPDENGKTPLMYAVQQNDVELVKLIINYMPTSAPADRTSRKVQLKAEDIDRADNKGMTALHHVAKPLPLGSYDNKVILQHLLNAGADVDIEDKLGQIPLQLALEHGSPEIAAHLQSVQKISNKKTPSPASATFEDPTDWEDDAPDFEADAAAMLEKIESDPSNLEDVPDPLNKPDPELKMDDIAEVVMDTTQDVPYSILMTKIDVAFGAWGLYNFYKMQVVRQKGKDLYILFNRWGRIGDTGNFQQTPFPSKEEALKEFCKIFKAKTKNEWSELDKFENHWGKYRLVQADERKRCRKLKGIEFKLKSDLQSKLSEPLQEMMREVTDVTAMDRAMGEAGVDITSMPFGQIKKKALEDAAEILNKLKDLYCDIQEIKNSLTNDQDVMTKYHDALSQLCQLTNEYYHLMPQSGFQYEKLTPLDNPNQLERELMKVYDLMELEFASKVLAAAQYRLEDMNPLDYIYRSVGCNIRTLEENATETQYLLKYIHNSASVQRSEIECIFGVSRPGEEERINNCGVDNPMLLFHGSNTCNLLSILRRGLLISPTNAQLRGQSFGKGIYTADVFAKSVGYCYNWGTNSRRKFMLICEVAVGSPEEIRCTHYHRSYEREEGSRGCTLAVGQSEPNSRYDIKLPTGDTIRLGELEHKTERDSYCVSYSEYVAHHEDQVRLRYIVQFK